MPNERPSFNEYLITFLANKPCECAQKQAINPKRTSVSLLMKCQLTGINGPGFCNKENTKAYFSNVVFLIKKTSVFLTIILLSKIVRPE